MRDEIRMVMASYQTLYESSIAFGLRKALLAEQRRAELQAKVRTSPPPSLKTHTLTTFPVPQESHAPLILHAAHTLSSHFPQIKLCTAELAELGQVVETISAKVATVESAEKEHSAAEQEKHAAEVTKLQGSITTLKEELEMLLAPPRK